MKIRKDIYTLTLAFIGIVCGSTSLGASEPLDLYLLAGQSNMSGRVTSGYTHNSDIDDDILYYYRSDGPPSNNQTSGGAFVTLGPLASGYYGPEIALGRALHAQATNKIAIVKISDGGRSLAIDWNSRAGSGNTWWQHWLNDTADALSDLQELGYEPVLKGICWLQGESDSKSEDRANIYEANFSNLTQDMLAYLDPIIDVSNVRFVVGRVGALPGTFPFVSTVRSAQSNVISTNANWRYFDTLDLTTFDGVHFNFGSVKTIGERFAEQLLASPTIATSRVPGGTFLISFSGILSTSQDLESWIRIDPQPPSPYQVLPVEDKMFFRANRN